MKILKKYYFDPKYTPAFSSIQNLYEYTKLNSNKVPRLKLKNWLSKQEVYSRNRYPQRKFIRSQFVSSKIDRFWSVDLADISKYKNFNDNMKFLLIAIDILSKFVWVVPMKNKTSYSTIKAFKKILFKRRKPESIICDAGSEFVNKNFKKLLIDNNINQLIMRNTEVKSAVSERFIRTLKEKISKFISYSKQKRFIDVLPFFVKNYNNTKHSRTKFKPVEVNKFNENEVFLNLFNKRIKNIESNLKPGDSVRILVLKKAFEKGQTESFSKEIFTIKKKLSSVPVPRFILEDKNKEEIIGSFYQRELIKI